MRRYITRSFCTLLFLLVIYFIYSAIISALGSFFDDGDLLGALIPFIIVLGLLTWLFSKLLAYVCYNNSFVYWLFCLGLSAYLLYIALNGKMNEPDPFSGAFAQHFVLIFFLIPKFDGTTECYLNREVKYDGYNTSYREWVSESYTPGWVSKVIAQVIIAAIAALAYTGEGVEEAMWFVFAVEGGVAGYLTLINFKYTFFG